MITIKTMSVLLKITSKLDIKPALQALKSLDIFEDAQDAKTALAQLTEEKAYQIAAAVLPEITPQLDVVADFLPRLAAAYCKTSAEEAEELNAIDLIKSIAADEDIRAFLSTALQRKVEQLH